MKHEITPTKVDLGEDALSFELEQFARSFAALTPRDQGQVLAFLDSLLQDGAGA